MKQKILNLALTTTLIALQNCSGNGSDSPFSEPDGFRTLQQVRGENGYEHPKYDFSKIDTGDCMASEFLSRDDLESKIRFADLECVGAIVKKFKIDLNQPVYGAFGEKIGTPLEVALSDAALFFAKGHQGGGAAVVVAYLIQLGANPNQAGESGALPIGLALGLNYGEYKDVIHYLISHPKTEVNVEVSHGETTLERAIALKNESIVNHLLNRDADVNRGSDANSSPLTQALSLELRFTAKRLIEKGAVVNIADRFGQTPLHMAVGLNAPDLVDLLLAKGARVNERNSEGQSPLHLSVDRNSAPIADRLITAGADIDSRDASNQSPLFSAVRNSRADLTDRLLRSKANVSYQDTRGNSLLHYATDLSIVKKLVAAKSPVDRVNKSGETPLSVAVAAARVELQEYLLDQGAQINWKDRNGVGLLHLAVSVDSTRSAQLLIRRGLSVNTADLEGRTPLFRVKSVAMLDLLATSGADINHASDNGQHAIDDHIVVRGESKLVQRFFDLGADREGGDKYGSYLLKLFSGYLFSAVDVVAATEMTRVLLKAKVSPTAKDSVGNTALHLVVGHYSVVTSMDLSSLVLLLIESGAVRNARNDFGSSALTIVSEHQIQATRNEELEIRAAGRDEDRVKTIRARYLEIQKQLQSLSSLLSG